MAKGLGNKKAGENVRKFFRLIRYTSLFCICLGLAISIGFLFRRQTERAKQLQIMAEFEKKIAGQLSSEEHLYTGAGTSDYTAIDGQTLAILRLDRLGIKVSVAEGIERETLRLSAGRFPASDMPGSGNFAIAGHSSFVYTCLFNDMHKATMGDVITVTTRTEKHQYIVTDIIVVQPTDVELLDHTNESVITIVTCTNSGAERLIIRGIEV